MNVFISWSGNRSRAVAQSLRSWLPAVLQHVTPWLSNRDIEPGSRWARDLADLLERTHVGIVCLTRENCESPWIIYEAGALSKSVSTSRVIPYLIDIEPSSLRGPLAAFQAVQANKAGTWELISCVHKAIEGQAQALSVVQSVFEAMWPQFEMELSSMDWRKVPQNAGIQARTWRVRGTVLKEGLPVADVKVKLGLRSFYYLNNSCHLGHVTTRTDGVGHFFLEASFPTVSATAELRAFSSKGWSETVELNVSGNQDEITDVDLHLKKLPEGPPP